jgi:hypothetical protein
LFFSLLALAIPRLWSGPIAGLDCAGRKVFAVGLLILVGILVGVLAGLVGGVYLGSLLIVIRWFDGSFGYGFGVHSCEIGDNLFWLRLFEFHALEIRRGDLERVEQEAGGFPFDSLLQDHLHDLANDGLNGVRIFKNRQDDFAGRVLPLGVTFDGQGTILLMVETKTFFAESGRAALGSADLDVLATSCSEGWHRGSW